LGPKTVRPGERSILPCLASLPGSIHNPRRLNLRGSLAFHISACIRLCMDGESSVCQKTFCYLGERILIIIVQITGATLHKSMMPGQRSGLRLVLDIEFVEHSGHIITNCPLGKR
jgi:hypothetical protein